MEPQTCNAIVEFLADYDAVVEIGIGRRPDVAAALSARGTRVTATDVHHRDVPTGVRFVIDDVTEPTRSVYADAEAIYGLNLPPELHRPSLARARSVGADFVFTTLGHDQPAVPVERRTVPGDTLFLATDRP